MEAALPDQLSGILQNTVIPFDTSVAQELRHGALEHLVACGHAVTWLRSFRYILVIDGYALGPGTQKAIQAELSPACTQGGWTVLKFQEVSRLDRPRLRRLKPKEDARLVKTLETGPSLLGEAWNPSLGTLVPALLLEAQRLKLDRKPSKTTKRRIVGQLVPNLEPFQYRWLRPEVTAS